MNHQQKALIVALALCIMLTYLLTTQNLLLAIFLIIIPSILAGVIFFLRSPILGLYLTIVWAFLGVGIKRYILSESGSALGLGVDILLVATWVVYFIKNFNVPFPVAKLRNAIIVFTLLWFGYNVFELINPEAPTFIGWFYAVRGVALYMLLIVPLAFLLLDNKKEIKIMMMIWFGFSLLGVLWGMKQLYIGLDYAEKIWLSEPGNLSTHLLFGKLRVFSFYSDSGQFGASMGHASIVALVLAIQTKGTWRIMAAISGLIFFYGLMISGTRGALAVPVVGAVAFLLLKRNWRLVIIGMTIMGAAYGTLKYTSIGSSIYEVQRMRTALDPNNASFQVRIENQKKLIEYLKDHPFGGGVGSAGYWGLRFNPNSFLANLALDSWYVKIAAEQGFPGLALFLSFVIYFLISGFKRIIAMEESNIKQLLIALYAGAAGIAVASYGNQVWGQMPTGIIIYLSIVVVWKYSDPKTLSKNQSVSSNKQA